MNIDNRLFNFENVFENFELHLGIGDIFQVAEVALEKGREYFDHKQLCDEITYVVSGKAKIFSGEDCALLSPGQIHFIRKDVNHRIVATPEENFRYICIAFLPNLSHPSVAAFYEVVANRVHIEINDHGYAKRLAELTVREFYNWDEYSMEMIDHFIAQILISMTRTLGDKSSASYSRSGQKNSSQAMYEVLRYLDREYLQIDSIRQVSDALSYSEYYLSHLFKEKMGITMKEYLNRKKISHATELLEQCDLTVEQISDHLKFASPRVFRRVFKQYTGSTPSAYRTK